jgi:hypothetical protein
MKILILGCGWYGSHCAMILKEHNIAFDIYDITNEFFLGSSSKNQNRLHLGFHYPRSYLTRTECKIGFDKFIDRYGGFTDKIENNYYCIDQNSIIDFQTYKSIFNYENIESKTCSSLDVDFDVDLKKFDGVVRVDERFVNFRKAKLYFETILKPYMISQYKRDDYDIIIDCTYSTLNEDMFYEQCISLLYEYSGESDFAITVVDGKFWSLYPYDKVNRLFTLTDVEFTPLGTEEARPHIENKIKMYIPNFDKHFSYKGYFISQKAKPNVKTDDRSLIWKKEGNTYYFSGGKLTGIFSMEDIIKSQVIELNKLC